MPAIKFLVDTNILIYHTKGMLPSIEFLKNQIREKSFYISVLTKIEFLGWDKHTPAGFEKCSKLLEYAAILDIDDAVANVAINIRKNKMIKLADAVIAATAIVNGLHLATRNVNDFKTLKELKVVDPFDGK